MTPWDIWTRTWDSGVAAAETGLRFTEMMRASHEVVASRCGTIAAAARDPLNGDYRELGRMVPEKVAAFGSAAASAIDDLHVVQSAAIENMRQLAAMAFAGRLPTAPELARLSDRTTRMAERALGAGGKAMAPVHRTATGNARRLKHARRG